MFSKTFLLASLEKKHALPTEISRREYHPLVFLENTEQMDDIVMNQKPETEELCQSQVFLFHCKKNPGKETGLKTE